MRLAWLAIVTAVLACGSTPKIAAPILPYASNAGKCVSDDLVLPSDASGLPDWQGHARPVEQDCVPRVRVLLPASAPASAAALAAKFAFSFGYAHLDLAVQGAACPGSGQARVISLQNPACEPGEAQDVLALQGASVVFISVGRSRFEIAPRTLKEVMWPGQSVPGYDQSGASPSDTLATRYSRAGRTEVAVVVDLGADALVQDLVDAVAGARRAGWESVWLLRMQE